MNTTTAPIKPLTEQEFFDTAALHLLKQGTRATFPLDDSTDLTQRLTCAYRAPDGTKCAIGCFITNEQYDPKMEDNSAAAVQNEYRLPQFTNLKMTYDSIVEKMQSLHDYESPAEWRAKLKALGDRFSLNTDVLGAI